MFYVKRAETVTLVCLCVMQFFASMTLHVDIVGWHFNQEPSFPNIWQALTFIQFVRMAAMHGKLKEEAEMDDEKDEEDEEDEPEVASAINPSST